MFTGIKQLPPGEARWLDQTVMNNDEEGLRGNCAQAAIASILAVPLEQVPNFIELTETATEFWDAIEAFLKSHGYLVEYGSESYRPPIVYLASGTSPRGLAHMVVMYGEELLHDPHPSRAGLVEITNTFILTPIDPAVRGTRI
jgi:hypothetical protein